MACRERDPEDRSVDLVMADLGDLGDAIPAVVPPVAVLGWHGVARQVSNAGDADLSDRATRISTVENVVIDVP